MYWLYGHHPVSYALSNPNRVSKKLLFADDADLKLLPPLPKNLILEKIQKKDFGKIVGHDAVHQGLALQVEPLEEMNIDDLSRLQPTKQTVMILDQVSDPHNVGAILRSCAVFGATALILTDRHSPKESAILAKSASGALEITPIIRINNLSSALSQLKDMGFWIVGLAERSEQTLSDVDFSGKMGIVMGAEGDGMRKLTTKQCDFLVRLETSALFSTLNVSNAAAIALYEAFRK